MTPTCILINGPKSVGKDTAASAIAGVRPGMVIEPVMTVAKHHAILEAGLEPGRYFHIFEQFKDTPFPELYGKTPRDLYIAFGDRERAKDPQAIAKLWLAGLKMKLICGASTILVPDVRFLSEFLAVLPIFQPANVLLLRIYSSVVTRWTDGLPFEDDIGSYFLTGAVWGHNELTLVNDKMLVEYQQEASIVGNSFIARRRVANNR